MALHQAGKEMVEELVIQQGQMKEISFKDRDAIFGRLEELAKGLAEGRTEGILEIAKNMKADGQPSDLIAKFTGLTIEEIEKL